MVKIIPAGNFISNFQNLMVGGKINLKNKLLPFLFRLARSSISGLFIGFSFAHLSKLLPVKRLVVSAGSIAFYHPVPSYDFHGLVVPKMVKPDFLAFDFNYEKDFAALIEILELCQQVGRDQNLPYFSTIVNGGIYQDVPQVHFHIAANKGEQEAKFELIDLAERLESTPNLRLFQPKTSQWNYHRILKHSLLASSFLEIDLENELTRDCLKELFCETLAILERERHAGFSIMINVRRGANAPIKLEIVSNHPKSD